MLYRCANCMKSFSSDKDDITCPHCNSSNVSLVEELEIYTGQTVDEYVIGEKIGEGAISMVFHATNINDNSEVVVKFPKNLFKNDKRYRERFLQEALILRSIEHENVLRLIKTIENSGFRDSANSSFRDSAINGNIILVTEYIDGIDLQKMLNLEGSFPLELSIDFLMQACNGLEQAHLKGIFHRDIKPDNFLVSKDNVLKVADFGLAKIRNTKLLPGSERISNSFKGTPAYSAPEQIRGEKPTVKSDIYSLGITAYQLCTGKLPFETGTVESILFEHLSNEIRPPRLVNPTIPIELENLILEMTDKMPDKRPSSMKEIHDRLDAIKQDMCKENTETIEPEPRKMLNPLFTFAALLLILIAIAFYFVQKHFNENERINTTINSTQDLEFDFDSMLQNMTEIVIPGKFKTIVAQNGNVYAYSPDKIYKIRVLKHADTIDIDEKDLQLIALMPRTSENTSLFDCETLLIHDSERFIIMQYPEKLVISEIIGHEIHHKLTLPKAFFSGFIMDDAEQKLFIVHKKYCNIVTFSGKVITLEQISHPASDGEIIDVHGVWNCFSFIFKYSLKNETHMEILNLQRDDDGYLLEYEIALMDITFPIAQNSNISKDLFNLFQKDEAKPEIANITDNKEIFEARRKILADLDDPVIAAASANSENTLILLTMSETAKTQLTLQIHDLSEKKPPNTLQINIPDAIAVNETCIYLFQKQKMLIVEVNFTDSMNVMQNKIFVFTEFAK